MSIWKRKKSKLAKAEKPEKEESVLKDFVDTLTYDKTEEEKKKTLTQMDADDKIIAVPTVGVGPQSSQVVTQAGPQQIVININIPAPLNKSEMNPEHKADMPKAPTLPKVSTITAKAPSAPRSPVIHTAAVIQKSTEPLKKDVVDLKSRKKIDEKARERSSASIGPKIKEVLARRNSDGKPLKETTVSSFYMPAHDSPEMQLILNSNGPLTMAELHHIKSGINESDKVLDLSEDLPNDVIDYHSNFLDAAQKRIENSLKYTPEPLKKDVVDMSKWKRRKDKKEELDNLPTEQEMKDALFNPKPEPRKLHEDPLIDTLMQEEKDKQKNGVDRRSRDQKIKDALATQADKGSPYSGVRSTGGGSDSSKSGKLSSKNTTAVDKDLDKREARIKKHVINAHNAIKEARQNPTDKKYRKLLEQRDSGDAALSGKSDMEIAKMAGIKMMSPGPKKSKPRKTKPEHISFVDSDEPGDDSALEVVRATHEDHGNLVGHHIRLREHPGDDPDKWPDELHDAIDSARRDMFPRVVVHSPKKEIKPHEDAKGYLLARFHNEPEATKRVEELWSKDHDEPYQGGVLGQTSWRQGKDVEVPKGWQEMPIASRATPESIGGVLGKKVITGEGPDPFHFADAKYQHTKKLLEQHRDLPLKIHTRSDLIANDDYMAHLNPDKHEVNIHVAFPENKWDFSSDENTMEPGQPSAQRRLSAYKKLKEAGIPVKIVVDRLKTDHEHPLLTNNKQAASQLRQMGVPKEDINFNEVQLDKHALNRIADKTGIPPHNPNRKKRHLSPEKKADNLAMIKDALSRRSK